MIAQSDSEKQLNDQIPDGAEKQSSGEAKTKTHYDDLKGKNVLVVEDHKVNCAIFSAILESEGVTVTNAYDGEEAVAAFVDSPEHAFDCILMDTVMPKLDGVKATERIRNSGRADAISIPIIGVSANVIPICIERAKNAGMNDYMIKPVKRDDLLRCVDQWIKSAKA
jgi:two-component system sensor histidine kinase/response regulator